MNGTTAKRIALVVILIGLVGFAAMVPAFAESGAMDAQASTRQAPSREVIAEHLDAIAGSVSSISEATRVRRSLAQATFCLPQNVLGILYYALLQATGSVRCTREMNETTVVVTRTPFGASLGRYLFVSVPLLTEGTVRHEYGHTLQGYRHGPFYLLLEGTASFVQAVATIAFPSLAEGYFDRWPENEANELGGVP